VEFLVLGPLEVRDGGRILPLGGAKQRAALALLLLRHNEVVSRDRLVDGLWGDSPPVSTTDALYAYISRLRKALHEEGHAERLVTRAPGYMLRVDEGELDLQRLEALVAKGRQALAAHDPQTAAAALHEGLALFRGSPLEDLSYAPFAQVEIRRLDDVRLVAVELRIDADLELGRDAELIGELQALVAQHPLRERFWAQLMLALYRSGRQGEALDGFDRARLTLADQLGVAPGQPLQRLQRRMLEGDPSLDQFTTATSSTIATSGKESAPRTNQTRGAPESAESQPVAPLTGETGRRRRHGLPRRRWAATTGMAIVLAMLSAFLIRNGRTTEDGVAPYRAGTVLLSLKTGKQVGFIPRAQLAMAGYPFFSGGHFWVNNFTPNSFVEIDPSSGRILKQIIPPPDPGAQGDWVSANPFTVQGNTLWAISGDDLAKIDIGRDRQVDRFRLNDYVPGGRGLAQGVAVGGGSVWVSRDVGPGQVVRLDPATGRVQHRFDNLSPHDQLAFGDGSLWVADESGMARIDAKTNLVTHVGGIQGNTWVVAGGGYGWTSDSHKGVVYKVNRAGEIADTYNVGIGASWMSYTGGELWVAAIDEGTVTGINATTGKATTYRFGHPVETATAGNGVLLAMLDPGQTAEGFFSSFTGTTAKLFADTDELLRNEPALDANNAAYQIENATCAKLLNYPDAAPPEGWQLRPEVARDMPTVSPDGRTYTFTLRSGYRFSPPSNQRVTAETFRYSIERVLSPKLAQYPGPRNQPGPRLINDIAGEEAFRSGAADHIAGLRARGDTLSITLTKPSPDFLERLALPYFCVVPIGTPFVAGAPSQGLDRTVGGYIDSAGPYYVAEFNNEHWVILKRNPNYHGPRPHALDVIEVREGVDASAALDRVQNQGWDGITHMSDPLLDPGGALAQRWGAASAATASGGQRYFLAPLAATRFIAFNTQRGIFAEPRVRRAASLVLDRSALAAVWGDAPTDQLLSPALPGSRRAETTPPAPSTAKAEALMNGRTGHVVMPVLAGCARCSQTAHLVQNSLATIAIYVRIENIRSTRQAFSHGGSFDLLDSKAEILYPDSASFLTQVLESIPRGWEPADARMKINRVANRSGDHRQSAAAKLAQRLSSNDVLLAAYSTPQTSEFLSPRLGCRIFSPFGYGVDLSALCLPHP
jgi:DNA-binding SARP family transcriptional activator/ABC-type oligopeptide transport system substrate-binding subunit